MPLPASVGALSGICRGGPRGTLGLVCFLVGLACLATASGLRADTFANPLAGTDAPDTVVALIPKNWPPQYQLDAKGRSTGFAVDVLNHVAGLVGVSVTYKAYDSFAMAVDALESGEGDLIPNSGITPDRVSGSFFTSPIETFNISVIVRREETSIGSVDDLPGTRVGVVEKNVGLFMLQDRPDLLLTVFPDLEKALFGLISGNVDALVYPESVLFALARRARLDGHLKVVGAPLREIKRGLRFSKGNETLRDRFEQGVQQFLVSDAYGEIYARWYGTPSPFWTTGRLVAVFVAVLLAASAVFTVVQVRTLRRFNRHLSAKSGALETLNRDLERIVSNRTKELEEEIAVRMAAQRSFESFFELSNTMNLIVDSRGVIKQFNHPWEQFLGRDAVGRKVLEFVDPVDRDRTDGALSGLLERGEISGFSNRYRNGHGEVRWLTWTAVFNADADRIYAVAQDTTEERRQLDRLNLAAKVFTSAAEGICITEVDGTIVEVNDAFCSITGYDRADVLGRNTRILKSGRHDQTFYDSLWSSLTESGNWRGEIWNRRKDGFVFPEILTISAVKDDSGRIANYVGLFSDITKIKKHEEELAYLAQYDQLTSLPNRTLLSDRLRQAMAFADRYSTRLALLYIDLDGFKTVNDTYGHHAGDEMLVAVGQRMSRGMRRADTLARIGGDEFVALIQGADDDVAVASVVDRLLRAASSEIDVEGNPIAVTASVGVTYYPQAEELDAGQLVRQADQAMYQAKLSGRNTYRVFNVAEESLLSSKYALISDVRRALNSREFVLWYQPKVNMRSGQVIGAEALIRWNHPDRGLLAPASFLPQTEDDVVSVEIGDWVLDEAFRQLDLWRRKGFEMPISVNVSAMQLQNGDFLGTVSRLCQAYPRVNPEALEMEILETSALSDFESVVDLIRAAQALGFKFALDDFGSGYSSMVYLKKLPVAVLKIDQEFVRMSLDNPGDEAILKSVVGLARNFEMTPLAEGVETVEIGEFLLKLGCVMGQGYAIAKPMAAVELESWARHWRPDSRWTRSGDEDDRSPEGGSAQDDTLFRSSPVEENMPDSYQEQDQTRHPNDADLS